MIDRYTIARIIDAANIVDVVSGYVKLTRKGANFWAPCPFHNEKTGSFSVSPSKNIYKCFGCGKGGNAVNFVMEIEHVTYPDALRLLAKKYNIEVPERELTEEERTAEKEREDLLAANEYAATFCEKQLVFGEGREVGLSYFHERGFNDEVIKTFHLGYWPEKRTALVEAVKTSGRDLDPFLKVQLVSTSEKTGQINDRYPFNGRVVFPWLSQSGKFVGFTARKLTHETKGVDQKYVNSSDNPIFKKSDELFGIYQAQQEIRATETVYMVEGQADVISLHQCGIKNVVACSGGNGLSEKQAHKLKRMAKTIILMYDSDAAGIKYTKGAIATALPFGFNVYTVSLPDGKDPDDVAREYNASDLIKLMSDIKVDWVTYLCNDFLAKNGNDVYVINNFLNETMLPLLAKVHDEMLRRRLVHHCAHLLQVTSTEENIYLNEIERFRINDYRRRKKQAADAAAEIGLLPCDIPPDDGNGPPPPPEDFYYDEPDDYVPEEPNSEPKRPAVSQADIKFVALEKLIMSYVLRYGDLSYYGDDKQLHSVLEFVVSEFIQSDQIQFRDPLYRRMFDEVVAHCTDIDFGNAESYFVHYPDPEISQEAVNLVSEKYQKSNIFTDEIEKLPETSSRRIKFEQEKQEEMRRTILSDVSKLIVDYKLGIIKEQERQLMADNSLPITERISAVQQLLQKKQQCAQLLDRVMP